jgi:hypothetical protein
MHFFKQQDCKLLRADAKSETFHLE